MTAEDQRERWRCLRKSAPLKLPGLGASRTSTRRTADIKGKRRLVGAEDLRGGIKFTTAL